MQSRFLPFLLIFSLVATCIEVDISVPGFPQIARYFNVSEGVIQLTIAYNFLGYCLGAFIYGPLSESFGRRKVMVIGNLILLLGALGCTFAPTIDLLLVSRFIQGIGASTSVVLVFAMIADVYQGAQLFKLFGLTNACLSITMAIAPILGGFINQAIGWRGNYAAVATLSGISWVMILFKLPETKQKLEAWNASKVVADYKTLLLSPKFMSASLVPSLLFASYMSYIVSSSFLYMDTYGLSTLGFVFQQAMIIGSFSIVSMLSSKVIQKLGSGNVVKLGIGMSFLSGISLIIMGYIEPRSPGLMTALMCLFSIGFAVCYPIIFGESLEVFPAMRGTASSANMGIRALLVSAFTGLTSHLYNGEPLMVATSIALGIFLAVIFTLGMFMTGRFVKGESYAS